MQDDNEPHTSTGVYSVMNDKWLTEPNRVEPSFDWKLIADSDERLKVTVLERQRNLKAV